LHPPEPLLTVLRALDKITDFEVLRCRIRASRAP